MRFFAQLPDRMIRLFISCMKLIIPTTGITERNICLTLFVLIINNSFCYLAFNKALKIAMGAVDDLPKLYILSA